MLFLRFDALLPIFGSSIHYILRSHLVHLDPCSVSANWEFKALKGKEQNYPYFFSAEAFSLPVGLYSVGLFSGHVHSGPAVALDGPGARPCAPSH